MGRVLSRRGRETCAMGQRAMSSHGATLTRTVAIMCEADPVSGRKIPARQAPKVTGGFAMRKHLLIALSTAALTSTAAFAQTPPNNLDKLGQFKTTGASPNIPTIPQTGPKADAVKKHLQSIKLPPGFHISLYALVPD